MLLSDHGREWIDYIEQTHPFLAIFSSRFYSFDLHTRKTNPATYQYILSTLNLQAEACLFIDDREKFLEVAKEVGLQTLHFTDSLHVKAILEAQRILR